MKRFFVSFCMVMLALAGTAYAAEQEVMFFRNAEITLQDRTICRDGKWMVSLRDLERLTDTQAMESEKGIIFQKSVMQKNSVGLKKEVKAYFLSNGMLLEAIDGSTQKLDGKEFYMDDTLYVRCREFAEALGYEVRWGKWEEKDLIEIHGKEMPEITLDVVYSAKENKVSGVMKNMEPQTFLYGGEFSIERKTENGWEEVKEAGSRDIDDVGYYMNAKRHYFEDGITNIERSVHTKLSAGEYRMCIPFSYTYHIQGDYVDYLNKKIENGDLCDIDWDYYYSSKWGKPDFFFEGEWIKSTHDLKKTTDYVLYGCFTVE